MSRRLTRRLKAALSSKQYGFVKVAVFAYRELLAKSTEEGSPFTFSYFSKELMEDPDAVVRHEGRPAAALWWPASKPLQARLSPPARRSKRSSRTQTP